MSPLALFVGSLLLSPLFGLANSASPALLHEQHASRSSGRPAVLQLAATVDNFSPQAPRPKKRRPAAPRTGPRPATGAPTRARPANDEGDGETPRRSTGAPAARRRAAPAGPDDEAQVDGEVEEEDSENERGGERAPAPRRSRRASSSDEEDDDEESEEAPLAAFPSVIPRMLSFTAGGGMMSRGFGFNTALQKDSAFPRPGFRLAVESYPLLRVGSGWLSQLGVAFDLGMEFGALGVTQQTGGTLTYPVSQRRYTVDIRYAFVPGERVVVLPAIGIGNSAFSLKTNLPMPPSACVPASTRPCIPGVEATYLVLALHLRVAATEHVALTLSGGYLLGLAVGQGAGQIGQERTPSMSGFFVEIGGNVMLTDWLALRFAVPFISHAFSFSGGNAPYSSATESYLGGTASAILFTD